MSARPAAAPKRWPKINQLRPDVVLLDIKMRDGNGFEVVEAVAQRPNPPLIIFVTAFDQLCRPGVRQRGGRLSVEAGRARAAGPGPVARPSGSFTPWMPSSASTNCSRSFAICAPRRDGDGIQPFETEFWLRGSGGPGAGAGRCDRLRQQRRRICRDPHAVGIASDARLDPPVRAIGSSPACSSASTAAGWCAKRDHRAVHGQIGRTEVVLRNGKRLPAGRVHLKQLRQSIQGNDAALE